MNEKEFRFRLLELTRDASRRGKPMQTVDYARACGGDNAEWDDELIYRISDALSYLADKGFIDAQTVTPTNIPFTLHNVRRITAEGTDVIENGGYGLEVVRPVQNIFNGPVGAVQSGDHNVANVTQHIGANEQRLVDALESLNREVIREPSLYPVAVLSEGAITEVRKRGVTEALRVTLGAIASAIQTAGAAGAAYAVLHSAAAAVGIALPTPMGP